MKKPISTWSVRFILLSGATTVAIVFSLDLFANDWLHFGWYIVAFVVGLILGGPIAQGLRPKDYDGEKPVREGMPNVWF